MCCPFCSMYRDGTQTASGTGGRVRSLRSHPQRPCHPQPPGIQTIFRAGASVLVSIGISGGASGTMIPPSAVTISERAAEVRLGSADIVAALFGEGVSAAGPDGA